MRRYGYGPESCDGKELRRQEPSLRPSVLGGVYFPEAATCEPRDFVLEVANRAARSRVEVREGAEVREVLLRGDVTTGVRLADGALLEADAVVLATGPFSAHIARRAGLRLPVAPGKGYHRDFGTAAGAPGPRIACVLHERSVFCTPLDGFTRYAGTMEFSGLNDALRSDRLEQLTASASLYFDNLPREAPRSEWCGIRPVCADGLPIVGRVPGLDGLHVATGHGMLGLTLGPVTGRIVTDLVFGHDPGSHATGLAPGRFM